MALLLAGHARLGAQGGVFTVQIGSAPLPPTPLVGHSEAWRFCLGTNAPPIGWQTNADALLDASWGTGPGGFGYEDGDDATVLQVMSNLCTTVFIRRSFDITNAVDPGRRLSLVMDYDDGFVAWLDGAEVRRSSNVPGAPGSEPPHTATTSLGSNHEALGYRGLPAETNDLGLVGGRLQPGTHVLALMGINASAGSSDLSLIADLALTGGQGSATEGAFFTLVTSNSVSLAGSNTLAGSAGVVINGVPADYDQLTGIWSKRLPLTPGMNRLFIAALDATGAILASTNKYVVSETTTTSVGGTLPANTTWTSAGGIFRLTNTVIVPRNVVLSIQAGTVVLLPAAAAIRAVDGGRVEAAGNEDSPVFFLPADGTSPWQDLSADRNGSTLNLHQAEIVAGQVFCSTNASVTIEDSMLRDYHVAGRNFLGAADGQKFTLRRVHASRYEQSRFSRTPVLIEDSLIENIGSDATDFADTPDVVVRRTTYRFGSGGNTDAIDLGGNPGMLVEGCLIHDFQDKGVSIADYSHGTIVSNTLIYKAGIGISTYAASNCVFVNNTIADSTTGLLLRERTAGTGAGHAFATNNIVWGNVTNIGLFDGATLAISYSDIDGTGVFPGIGNLNVDPLFAAPASGDYRLTVGSPALHAGVGGVNMGSSFPLGGIPAPPLNLAAQPLGTNGIRLTWRDDSENEAAFLVERSLNSAPWLAIGSASAGVTSYLDAAAPWDALCRYRVRATNHAGLSRSSNLAGATLQSPIALVGGILTSNTVWSPALGTVLAISPVLVPLNLTLTIEAGTQFRATNNGGIRVEGGGTLNVNGTEERRVVFMGAIGTNLWSGLSATGSNALLTVRHAEIKGGPVGATNGATMLLEDCYIHDFKAPGGWAIGACENAALVSLRRCHFKFYHETLWRGSLMTIEECLFEYADNSSSDALDFDGVSPGSVIRRCTFRHGPQVNTDAIDLGPGLGKTSVGIVIQDTLMYDFPHDGGISAGEGVWGLVVSNCLIYGCRGGIKAKETPGEPANPTTMSVYQCTIVDNVVAGFSNYLKSCSTCLAGQITNSANNIVHGNPIDIVLLGQGVLNADHTVFGSTAYVGNGTFNQGEGVMVADPLFQDRAGRDYRLRPGSPCLGTGRDGTDMGCYYPVGAPMAASHPSIESITIQGGTNVIRFWADSERSYTLQAAETLQGGQWIALTNVSTRLVPYRIKVSDPLSNTHRFYRLVTPQQP